MLYVILSNAGGELDRRTAIDDTDAVEVLRGMLDEIVLAHGDTISIVNTEEE